MKNFRTLGTGATIATFAVIAVSGVALFIGIRGGNLKLIHEYIGVAMVVACVLHIVANFRPFANYFKGLKGVIIGAFSAILIALCFISFGANAGGKSHAPKMAYQAILNMDLATAKSAFKTNEAKFNEFLQNANLTNANQNVSIKEFAKANGVSENDLVSAILPQMKKGGK